jgi:hypothetical protein
MGKLQKELLTVEFLIFLMEQKKILIIAQAIYPALFPRSFRATELAKELARQGHEVILYAVLGSFDYSRFEKEYNFKVKNIGKMWFATLNSDGKGRRNFFDKAMGRLFHRLFEFPDIELMFRIHGIIRKEPDVDILISVAYPFPIHWGCALSKSLNGILFPKNWVADCGDPYMGNQVGDKKYFYYKYIEKWFCRKTDFITVPLEGAKGAYYEEFRKKIKVIPQGFRFDNLNLNIEKVSNDVPTFAYSGVLYKGNKDPSMFLEHLTTLKTNFKFILYTQNIELIRPYMKKLNGRIEVRDYVPREQLLYVLSQMDFLVNFEYRNSVQSPSKLIDYAIVKKPILSINTMTLPIDIIDEFLNGDYSHQFIVKDIDQYNIVNVANKFISLSTGSRNEIT